MGKKCKPSSQEKTLKEHFKRLSSLLKNPTRIEVIES